MLKPQVQLPLIIHVVHAVVIVLLVLDAILMELENVIHVKLDSV